MADSPRKSDQTEFAAGASEKPGTACVLLCRAEAPAELLTSLAQRRVVIEPHTDPFLALAAVLRRAETGAPLVLLVVEPAGVARSDELVRTVERFAPQVVCWRFDAGREPALRGYIPPPPLPSPAAADTYTPIRDRSGPPRLRLAGNGATTPQSLNPPEAGGVAPEASGAGPELLSSEELSMLLSEDWPPAKRPSERGR